jgi:apolipoprotein N-acyltransferase
MRRNVRFLLPDGLTVLSAVLYVLAFPPWNLSWLAWICLVPWLLSVRRAPRPAAAAVQGLWMSILISVLGFYWVAYVLRQFAMIPWPVAVVGLLLYSLIGQPQFYLFAPVLGASREVEGRGGRLLAVLLACALAYAGLDWVLPKLFVDTLGHAFYSWPRLRQVADLGGATLLTFLAFFVNHVLAQLWDRWRARTEPSLWPPVRAVLPALLTACALIAAAGIYGARRLSDVRAWMAAAPRHLQAAVIQANVGDFDKLASENGVRGAADQVLTTYYKLTDQALELTPRPDIAVWPETSYPSTFRTPMTADELARDQGLEQFVRSRAMPVLFGGYDRDETKDYNAFFFLTPRPVPGLTVGPGKEADLQTYRKNILLLFGEYIPGAETFDFLQKLFPQVGNFGRGPGPTVFRVPMPRWGEGQVALAAPVICYEILFPNYLIGAARQGGQFIVNVTNDSWFGPWGEPELHLALTTFRSVETRMPQLRATNTGISAVVQADGEITDATPTFEQVIMNARVPVTETRPTTLMVRWGDWFGPFACALGFTVLAALLFAAYRRKNAPRPFL